MAVAAPSRPGTRAQVRYVRMSASKARAVLDLIRRKSVAEAEEALILSQRDAALVIQKCLRSAVANAEHNEGLDPDELFVSACFADEGPTLRRFRPRARGRATRIRKRTCHITVEISRYDAEELAARQEREGARGAGARRSDSAARARRVARSRGEDVTDEEATDEEATDEAAPEGPEDATEDTEDIAAVADATEEAPSAEDLVGAHTKDELLAMAEEAGVEVAKSWTKPQIAEAITDARDED